MKAGIVAGLADVATGMASLKAAGEPEKTSTTYPLRSVAQSPNEGASRFTGCAVGGSVDSDTCLACKPAVIEKFDRVPSLLTVYSVQPVETIQKACRPGPIRFSFRIESPE